ncbi:MAG: hypothetical protein AAGG75_03050 [Bacteroidota bacterium]
MVYQNEALFEWSQELVSLHKELLDKGLKNKEIAKVLGIYPSAYSSLINKVLQPLLQLDIQQKDAANTIRHLFEQVNNISETRTRKRLPQYIEKLEALRVELNHVPQTDLNHYIKQLILSSPPEIMKHLQGVFDCYYLSSFGYRIKREPFLIQYSNRRQQYIIRKGNERSLAQYQGFGYLSNHQTFTIQMQEMDTLIPDNFIAHFHLPPSYTTTMNMLKGISVSMSNSYLPISRKVILHRLSPATTLKDFHQLETQFFEENEEPDNTILNYLRASTSFMEYVPIPHPEYDVEDLVTEKKVLGAI